MKMKIIREIVEIRVSDIKLEKANVFKNQDIPLSREHSLKVETLFTEAMELFIEFSHPKGLVSEIPIPEFEVVYFGEGLNEKKTPLNEIFKNADYLALFAVTIGEKLSKKIGELFELYEFALGSMLDAVASEGTEKVTDIVENRFSELLAKSDEITSSTGILRYCPGYCGWHMSGQKKLFEFLHPEDIGVTLLDSYLMKPLKSISGVIVIGEKEIHNFIDSYAFCSQCKTHFCRDRISELFRE